jgi:hypothetical protein
MENIMRLNDGIKKLSSEELLKLGGKDYIIDACAVIGLLTIASGGVLVANPIGGTVVGFCLGYRLGTMVSGWL